jgi:hypothetical protein
MRIRAVGDNLSIFVGQQLWREFLDLFRGDVHGSRYVERGGDLRNAEAL